MVAGVTRVTVAVQEGVQSSPVIGELTAAGDLTVGVVGVTVTGAVVTAGATGAVVIAGVTGVTTTGVTGVTVAGAEGLVVLSVLGEAVVSAAVVRDAVSNNPNSRKHVCFSSLSIVPVEGYCWSGLGS